MGLRFSPTTSTGKWLGLVTAIWVQSISGNNYTFSNYSDALKSLMGLTQLQLNSLSVAKDCGKAFGVLSGLASDRLSTPIILLIGSVEGFIGYGVQWLVVSQKIRPLPCWQMAIFLCMGGNSTTWMNTAVLVTCMRNFRKNRGPVAGILKGYLALSTAIFTDVCTALFSEDPSSFLAMLAIIPAVVCTSSMIFLREVPPTVADDSGDEQKGGSRYFVVFNSIAIVIAVYLSLFDLTGNHGRVVSLVFAAVLLLLLAAPLGVPSYDALKAGRRPISDIEGPICDRLLNEEVEETRKNGKQEEEKEISVLESRKPVIGEDHNVFEAVRTVDFWILFVSFLCGVGTGMTVMNNMGQMGLAVGYVDVSMFVSLTSIWGFFGRIGSGTVSEYFLKKAGTARPVWNAASQVLMAIGYVVMAMALPGSLYVGSIVVGICYGVRLAITVPLASEMFGLKYYGLIYNILILNIPIGSFLFSGLLAGFLYDAQATETADGGNTCVGPHCYRLVFLIMALACVLGFGLDVLLTFRTKSLYSKIYAKYKKATTSQAH